MTFGYDVSFVVDRNKSDLSTLPKVLLALLDLLFILFVDCEVYLIPVLIPFCFSTRIKHGFMSSFG